MAVKFEKLTFNSKVMALLCKCVYRKTFYQVSANLFLYLYNLHYVYYCTIKWSTYRRQKLLFDLMYSERFRQSLKQQ